MDFKTRILLFFVIVVVSVFAAQRDLPLEIWEEQFEPHRSTCICESGVNPDLIDNLFKHGELPDNACFKCHLKCYATRENILTPEGIVDINNFQKIYGVTEEIAIICSKFNHTDLCEKAYKITQCVFEHVDTKGTTVNTHLN